MSDYNLIIAGSRSWTDRQLMENTLREFWEKFIKPRKIVIVSGMARGADMMGYNIGVATSTKVIEMPANWVLHGKSAGYRRNKEMAKIADGALICWDGESKGAKHMYDLAGQYDLDTVIIRRLQPPPDVSIRIFPGKNYRGKDNFPRLATMQDVKPAND